MRQKNAGDTEGARPAALQIDRSHDRNGNNRGSMLMDVEFDFVVVGGGIAGSSVAAHLAKAGRVCLLEMEEQPGYHSTGRSAALFSEAYGNETIRALTRASRETFYSPSPEFCSGALVKPRDVLVLAHEGQQSELDWFVKATSSIEQVDRLSPAEAAKLCPILRPESLIGAAVGRRTADIEVHELHQAYLRQFKAAGGSLFASRGVLALDHNGSCWSVGTTAGGTIRARSIINAAGAWAGQIGTMAGAKDIGLTPLKRTACLIPAPEGVAIDKWPMVLNVAEEFYLKPDAGSLLLSPADETLSDPCDAHADEMDIAIAVDRLEQATTMKVRRVTHSWAGLRSFVADSSPVVGYDPLAPNFFWLAALGGYGIQTAPALGLIAARLAARQEVGNEMLDFGIDLSAISPDRAYESRPVAHMIGVARL